MSKVPSRPVSEWVRDNPVIPAGTYGHDSDNDLVKLGDGTKRWNDIKYVTYKMSDELIEKQASSGPGLVRRQVAGRCALPSPVRNFNNSAGQTKVNQEMRLVLTEDVSDIEMLFPNLSRSTPGETNLKGFSRLTVRAAIFDGQDTYPMFDDDGRRDIVIDPGGTAKAIAPAFHGKKGQTIWLVRHMIWDTAPPFFPASTVLVFSGSEKSEVGASITDRTETFNDYYTRQAGQWAINPPIAITATAPAKSVWAILGDSIASDGTSDYSSDNPDFGWAQRGLADAGVPYVNLGTSSLSMVMITSSKKLRAQKLAYLPKAGVTHLLLALSTNDWSAGRTGQQVYDGVRLMQEELKPLGIKVVPCTSTPKTLENTANPPADGATTFAERAAYNQLIRSNNGVGDGYFDLASETEDQANKNRWRQDLRAAGNIEIVNGGTGCEWNDLFVLPGSGVVVVGANNGVANEVVPLKGLGGWIVDPPSVVTPVRQISNAPWKQGVCTAQGVTFRYTGVGPVAATVDGVHPSAPMSAYVASRFSDFVKTV